MTNAHASSGIRVGVIACLLACCAWWHTAAAGRFDKYPHETAADPTRDYLPAKYFERMALEAMRHRQFAAALGYYKKAAYWGDKVAEYNVGQIYFRGMGSISQDPARGVAWFGIAAEAHRPDYDKALLSAYKALDPGQRKRAVGLFAKLQAVYGDKLTLARATRVFEHDHRADRVQSLTSEDDPNTYSIRISGYYPQGNLGSEAQLYSELNELGTRNGVKYQNGYWAARQKEFAQFITKQYGRVDIGPIEPATPSGQKSTQ
jgi:hypothetical protein